MGLFRFTTRLLLLMFIINIVDSIVCIIWPRITNNLHLYPSMMDSFTILVNAPWMFSLNIKVTLDLVRAVAIILTVTLLIALVSYRKIDTLIFYESMILILTIIILFNAGLSAYGGSNFTDTSLYIRILRYVFIDKSRFIIQAIFYHMPFGVLALLMYVAILRYREFLMQLKFLRVPSHGAR